MDTASQASIEWMTAVPDTIDSATMSTILEAFGERITILERKAVTNSAMIELAKQIQSLALRDRSLIIEELRSERFDSQIVDERLHKKVNHLENRIDALCQKELLILQLLALEGVNGHTTLEGALEDRIADQTAQSQSLSRNNHSQVIGN